VNINVVRRKTMNVHVGRREICGKSLFFTVMTMTLLMAMFGVANSKEVLVTTGLGKEITLKFHVLKDKRDHTYCELAFQYENSTDVYLTEFSKECSSDWFDNLDLDAVARELGAKSVHKNGPQSFSMDEHGLMISDPVTIAGVSMVFGLKLPPGVFELPTYKPFYPDKNQTLLYKAGTPRYQLVDPDDNAYVIMGYKLPKESLVTLGKDLELPDGWEYHVVVSSKDLYVDLTGDPRPHVRDKFNQVYAPIFPAKVK
jgi:hypothetical protein